MTLHPQSNIAVTTCREQYDDDGKIKPGAAEFWHADPMPESALEKDLAQAKLGFLVTVRVRRANKTIELRLTLDEALELRDALDMVRHRSYEPKRSTIEKLRRREALTEQEALAEFNDFDRAQIAGVSMVTDRETWLDRKFRTLGEILADREARRS